MSTRRTTHSVITTLLLTALIALALWLPFGSGPAHTTYATFWLPFRSSITTPGMAT